MQTYTLPLFTNEPKELEKELLVTEEKIITPLVQVLDQVTPNTATHKQLENSQSFTQSLNDLFPEQAYQEKDIQKAKEILGQLIKEFTSEQLKGAIIEIEYLAQSWLDDLERDIFKGLTLKEVLHEKGGL